MAVRLIMNTVIAGGNQGTPYQASVGTTKSFQIDAGGKVSTCWYVPIDNIRALTTFTHIEVSPGPEANQITLTINPATETALRILIYGDNNVDASQSNLSNTKYGYDFVVAATQGSLNATMKEYLSTSGEPEVVVCYIADQQGNPTQIDYAQLKQNAHGSDPFAVPANADPKTNQDLRNLVNARFMVGFKAQVGLPPGYAPAEIPDVIVLSGDASSVSYNLMCSEFIVVQLKPGGGYDPPSWMSVSQPKGKAWQFTSKVDLRLEPYGDAYSKLPQPVQAAIKNLGPDAFSIQQLLFDLDNAALESIPTMQGVDSGTDLYACLQKDFLGKYFSTVKQNGQPVLGCVVARNADKQAPGAASSLTLTDFDFQVSPFLGSDSQPVTNPSPEQKDLFTLDYLCAAGGRKLPSPAQFDWNWMEPGDEANFDGVMSINRDALVRYFEPILKNFASRSCYQPEPRVTLDGLNVQFFAAVHPGQMPTVDRPPTGAKVLGYAYRADATDVAGANGDMGQLQIIPSYSMDVSFLDKTIVISQQCNIWVRVKVMATETSGNTAAVTLVDTYTIDVDASGKLVLAAPKTTRTDNSQNLEVNSFVNFFTNINSLVDNISSWAQQFVSAGLIDIPLSFAQNFVFPGGKTFVFKNARFSDFQDLVANITYAVPT